MTSNTRARALPRRIRIRRIRAATAAVAIAAVAVIVAHHTRTTSFSAAAVAPSPASSTSSAPRSPAGAPVSERGFRREIPGLGGDERGALGEADGAVPDSTTVFDSGLPGVANLDPTLLGHLREAAAEAAADGVEFRVDSGWRSPEYQQRLLQEAVLKYGSYEDAARWVATPTTSAHVSGNAVDIGRSDATAWLSEHGAGYGLCQIYANEPWHYEVRAGAAVHGCPPMYADATHDPRIQQRPQGTVRRSYPSAAASEAVSTAQEPPRVTK